MAKQGKYRGVIPAVTVPFRADLSIDDEQLHGLVQWLVSQRRIAGLLMNGHTGEVFSLLPKERADVTRIAVKAAAGKCPIISAVVCEGIEEALEHAHAAKEAGATALDVMPPHHWLRFGFKPEHVIDYFDRIGDAVGLDLIVHTYPAWTKASYSSQLLADLSRLPHVKAFKIGTREMNKYARDIKALRDATPDAVLLTCHDEYLLASLVQRLDGALVGFASLIPGMIADMLDAVDRGDLKAAMDIQDRINPLKEVVYGAGEPTGDAHTRMKAAMVVAGLLTDGRVRPPFHAPSAEEMRAIRTAVQNANFASSGR